MLHSDVLNIAVSIYCPLCNCSLLGKKGNVGHHTSYSPENIVYLHRRCHAVVHGIVLARDKFELRKAHDLNPLRIYKGPFLERAWDIGIEGVLKEYWGVE